MDLLEEPWRKFDVTDKMTEAQKQEALKKQQKIQKKLLLPQSKQTEGFTYVTQTRGYHDRRYYLKCLKQEIKVVEKKKFETITELFMKKITLLFEISCNRIDIS